MATKPPRFDPAAAKQRLQQQREALAPPTAVPHPARPLGGPRTATDHLVLAPEEIVLEGPYVRQHVDEQELDQLRQAIQAGGEIKQAIGVRTEGTPLEPRYVLVYGMRRWLASKAAGLARVPVRNHGRITVAESLALQVTENEARVDPHSVDTAVSYQMLVQEGGMSQAEVARVAGRSAAHVSYMRAVGEAVLLLAEEERQALYRSPEATVPRFQRIAPLKDARERAAALRALLNEGGSRSAAPSRPATVFRAGPARANGVWSLRVSYRDEELRQDPELAARLERFLEEQLERLREQLRPQGAEGGPRRPVTWEIAAE
jgi:ParB/RepB/Spo0J family partition protein